MQKLTLKLKLLRTLIPLESCSKEVEGHQEQSTNKQRVWNSTFLSRLCTVFNNRNDVLADIKECKQEKGSENGFLEQQPLIIIIMSTV